LPISSSREKAAFPVHGDRRDDGGTPKGKKVRLAARILSIKGKRKKKEGFAISSRQRHENSERNEAFCLEDAARKEKERERKFAAL